MKHARTMGSVALLAAAATAMPVWAFASGGVARLAASVKEDESKSGPQAGGWLGVQLGEVPAPLAAQLGTDEHGVLVVNIVKDSPAEKAGLERYDVITEVNGEKIAAGDIGGLSERVGGNRPGQSVKLTVLRSGQQRQLNVTLGQRPSDEAWDWKYEYTPDMMREQSRSRARVLQRGPNGAWEMHDVQPDFLKDLPDEIQRMLPPSNGMSTRIYVDNDRRMITARVDRDGTAIEVSQKDDGPITVRRAEAGARADQATEKTYNSEDELQTADPQAYEVFKDAQRSHSFRFDRNGQTFSFNLGNWPLQSEKWREELQRQMDEARRSFDEAMKQFQGAPGLWFNTPGGQFRMHGLFGQPDEDEGDADDAAPGSAAPEAKPRQSFRVNPDGQIECHIRKGDSELIKVYRDENELKSRDPELYDAYKHVSPK